MTNSTEILHPSVADAVKKLAIDFETLECDPALADTAAFCDHYKFAVTETANCIIAASKSEPIKYACCVILANAKLDVNKKLSQLMGIKRLSFASADTTLALTGMQIGGVTPFGLPDMPTYIDSAVMNNERVLLGGGNRSSKLIVAPSALLKIPELKSLKG